MIEIEDKIISLYGCEMNSKHISVNIQDLYGFDIFKIKKDEIIQKCTVYTCIRIDMDGKKEVLSLHIGGSESAKYWLSVMNDLKSRGMQDVLIFCTDNLTGLNEAINACYPNADHQKCIVHQIRNSVKHVSYKASNGEIGLKSS